jgi:hypothetical protein
MSIFQNKKDFTTIELAKERVGLYFHTKNQQLWGIEMMILRPA